MTEHTGPTRTPQTETRYRKRFGHLMDRAQCETGAPHMTLDRFAQWFRDRAPDWSKATVRQYRAACVQELGEASPRPCPGRPNQSAARRSRSVPRP